MFFLMKRSKEGKGISKAKQGVVDPPGRRIEDNVSRVVKTVGR